MKSLLLILSVITMLVQITTFAFCFNDTSSKVIHSIDTTTIKKDSIQTYYIVLWGTGFLSLSKSTYQNWQQAGENHFSLLWEIEPFFKTSSKKHYQEQRLSFRYGYLKTDSKIVEKSEDNFMYTSTYRRHMNPKTNIQSKLKIQTQISKTFLLMERDTSSERVLHSSFLSPAYIYINLGIQRKFHTNTLFNVGFSACKISLVRNQDLYSSLERDVIYNVPKGNIYTFEYGVQMEFESKIELHKNIEIEHKSSYFIDKNRKSGIDIDSRTILSLKVNKHIKTMITHQLIYDRDIIDKAQIQQQILVGYYF